MSDSLDKLWEEYRAPFTHFDDITLARWLAQTLGQLEGRLWRASHPLVGAYRLAAQEGESRQIWSKRLATVPPGFPLAECCRAPLFPLFTRDVMNGLVCQHCGGTVVEWDDIPKVLREQSEPWAKEYADVHAVAHWDDEQQRSVLNYDEAFERAATQAEELLKQSATQLLPTWLDHYPALVWEDQDECLEVQPADIDLKA